jgi:TRAP-type transport system small permease protein
MKGLMHDGPESAGKRRAMKRLVRVYDAGALLSFAAMMVCVLLEVVARNVFHFPTTWAEEMSRFMCVWTVFLASASAWYRGAHIVVNVLPRRLENRPKKYLTIFLQILSGLFLLCVWVGSLLIMFEQYAAKTSAMEISISWFYLALFLGSTGMLIFHAQQMFEAIRADAATGFPKDR